jgi:hypothetical protein
MIRRYPQDSASGLANARRLRLGLVAAILLVLVWVLLDSLEDELARAQQQGAKLTLNQIRSVLVVKGAEVRLNGSVDYEAQAGRNPFAWFETTPPAYIGICAAELPKPGKWCFKPLQTGNTGYKKPEQADLGQVIFRPNQPITLEDRQGSREAPLAWVVGIEFRDRNGNGRLDSDEPQSGLKLEPTEVTQARESDND